MTFSTETLLGLWPVAAPDKIVLPMIAQDQTEMARRGCELCGATAARELYTATDRLRNSDQLFAIVACEGCGLMRTLPEMGERELTAFYPADYWAEANEPSDDWIRKSQSEKTGFLSRCNLRGGRILDVGCGAGWFLRALESRSWDRFGVETGEGAAGKAAQALGGERIFRGNLTRAPFEDSTFDVVTFWSALEHMNEPRRNLAAARRMIRPGGTLVVQVPNAASYQARFFGGDWSALDVPRHRYHFTEATLNRLLLETGFESYFKTFLSRSHNAHALKQSLKARMCGEKSELKRALFFFSVWMIKPFDRLMTALSEGATLTVAARAV